MVQVNYFLDLPAFFLALFAFGRGRLPADFLAGFLGPFSTLAIVSPRSAGLSTT